MNLVFVFHGGIPTCGGCHIQTLELRPAPGKLTPHSRVRTPVTGPVRALFDMTHCHHTVSELLKSKGTGLTRSIFGISPARNDRHGGRKQI